MPLAKEILISPCHHWIMRFFICHLCFCVAPVSVFWWFDCFGALVYACVRIVNYYEAILENLLQREIGAVHFSIIIFQASQIPSFNRYDKFSYAERERTLWLHQQMFSPLASRPWSLRVSIIHWCTVILERDLSISLRTLVLGETSAPQSTPMLFSVCWANPFQRQGSFIQSVIGDAAASSCPCSVLH